MSMGTLLDGPAAGSTASRNMTAVPLADKEKKRDTEERHKRRCSGEAGGRREQKKENKS